MARCAATVCLLALLGFPGQAVAATPLVRADPAAPVAGTFEDDAATFGVTVRNRGAEPRQVDARLLLDEGAELPAGPGTVDAKVGDQTLRLGLAATRTQPLAPGAVVRLGFTLTADQAPKQAVTGTLVIGALAVPVSLAPEAAAGSRFEKARVTPPSVTLIVRRHAPSFMSSDALGKGGRRSVAVDAIAKTDALSKGGPPRDIELAGDTGGTAHLRVTIPDLASGAVDGQLKLEVRDADRRGTYEATVPLDPDAEKSPTVTVKVIVGDSALWMVITLLLGAGLAWAMFELTKTRRPKRVLQLALARAQERDKRNRDATTAPHAYSLEGLFPAKWGCGKESGTGEALELYCAIKAAGTKEKLEALALEVNDLEARVNAWPGVMAKVAALRAATAQLPEHAIAMRAAAQTLVAEPEPPADAGATTAYAKALDDQVTAIREWHEADVLLVEARKLFGELGPAAPVAHNPKRWEPDLRSARSLADLRRCGVVSGLCRDLHVLRARITVIRAREAGVESALTSITKAREQAAGSAPIVEDARDQPPGPELTHDLESQIRAIDLASFAFTATVTTVVYVAAGYSDTWGSIPDYLTALGAGAGGTFATSWKLLPWFRRLTPPKVA